MIKATFVTDRISPAMGVVIEIQLLASNTVVMGVPTRLGVAKLSSFAFLVV